MGETVSIHQAIARVAAAASELDAANKALGDLFGLHTARCDHPECWSPAGSWDGCRLVDDEPDYLPEVVA